LYRGPARPATAWASHGPAAALDVFRHDESDAADGEVAALADAAWLAADRAGAAIDDALNFIDASNKRIAAVKSKAAKRKPA
jgi:hypothetical protein